MPRQLSPETIREAMRQHMLSVRHSYSPAEAADAGRKARLANTLKRLRPVVWPKDDPLSGPQVEFILGWLPNTGALTRALKAGRIPYTQDERRRIWIKQADLKAYIASILRDAEAAGLKTDRRKRR